MSGPAAVPVRAVSVLVAVAGAQASAPGAAKIVTLPGMLELVRVSGVWGSVCFYCLYRSLISRLGTLDGASVTNCFCVN